MASDGFTDEYVGGLIGNEVGGDDEPAQGVAESVRVVAISVDSVVRFEAATGSGVATVAVLQCLWASPRSCLSPISVVYWRATNLLMPWLPPLVKSGRT